MVLVYAKEITPRLKYATQLLFDNLLNVAHTCTADPGVFTDYTGPRLVYGQNPELLSGAPRMFAHSLLAESDIRPLQPIIGQRQERPSLFTSKEPTTFTYWSYDLLATVFYIATRYEEYLPFQPDVHGRFSARQSILHQLGVLNRPWLQELALDFRQFLQSFYPDLRLNKPPYTVAPTYDVDYAWAFGHRSGWREWATWGKLQLQMEKKVLQLRRQVKAGHQADPFFTFPYLDQLHDRYQLAPIYFFLLARPGRFDRNVDPRRPEFRVLIRAVANRAAVGIHPSYAANRRPARIASEKQTLADIVDQPITRSRQHFLKLHLPKTYRQLIAAGIREDYTMGYADAPGFRAGLAVPFPWFDLERNEITDLMIYPFCVMDVTLKNYLQLQPDQAKRVTEELIRQVRLYGGAFRYLWHNSSFSSAHSWAGWTGVFEHMINQACTSR